jgi:nucleotide-binding universal stress UspA family protein
MQDGADSGPVVVVPGTGASRAEADEWAARYAAATGHEVVELEAGDLPLLEGHTSHVPTHAESAALVVLAPEVLAGIRPVVRLLSAHFACPVVVVHGLNRPTGHLPRPVLVGVTADRRCRRAIEFAFDYAARFDREVLLLHAEWERTSRGSSALDLLASGHERGISETEELLIGEAIAGLPERYPEVAHRMTHRSTDPATALLEASDHADLVVVGPGGHAAARSVIGRSVSAALVEEASCPVAIVEQE